jgi:hypothetical protein
MIIGAVQLVAFDCEYMVPVEFKEQLKRAFNLTLTANELGNTNTNIYYYYYHFYTNTNTNANTRCTYKIHC